MGGRFFLPVSIGLLDLLKGKKGTDLLFLISAKTIKKDRHRFHEPALSLACFDHIGGDVIGSFSPVRTPLVQHRDGRHSAAGSQLTVRVALRHGEISGRNGLIG